MERTAMHAVSVRQISSEASLRCYRDRMEEAASRRHPPQMSRGAEREKQSQTGGSRLYIEFCDRIRSSGMINNAWSRGLRIPVVRRE